jgi:hypothetical protein
VLGSVALTRSHTQEGMAVTWRGMPTATSRSPGEHGLAMLELSVNMQGRGGAQASDGNVEGNRTK